MGPVPQWAPVLAAVRVDAGLRRAYVAGRELRAENGRELRVRLVSALYETFHAGHRSAEAPSGPARDRAFEAELKAAVPHSTTPAAAVESGTRGVVVAEGVRVRPAAAPRAGEPVRLPAHRPGLSPGYFLADGSRGRGGRGPALRVYVHTGDPDEALRTWGKVVRALEEAAVPYRAKVLSSRRLFPRRDGLVVYLGPAAWHAAPAVVAAAAPPSRPSARHPRTSAFARTVAPGVALAWEPEDARPGHRGMSFGQHRSAAVADAAIAHAREKSAARTVHEHVREQMRAANIAPDACYRNLNSPNPAALEKFAP